MPANDDIRFTSCSFKLPPFNHSLPLFSIHHCTPQFLIDSLRNPPNFPNFKFNPKTSIPHFFTRFITPPNFLTPFYFHPPSKSSLLCSASLALSQNGGGNSESYSAGVTHSQPKSSGPGPSPSQNPSRDEERVLISEVWVKNKDGDQLERKDLESEALNALKASRPNSALTVRDVQEDVHRIIASGYFASCMPVAVDTRDGVRLVFQVYVYVQ